MVIKRLLLFGPGMIVIYLAILAVAMSLTPEFSAIRNEPSELGISGVAYPQVYNGGMVATAMAGWLAAIGLFAGLRRIGTGPVLAALTAAGLVLASAGIAMSGLYPLPNPLHYGFSLSAAGALLPLPGALARFRAMDSTSFRDGVTLLSFFALIILSAMFGTMPLVVGLIMFGAIAFLCIAVRARL